MKKRASTVFLSFTHPRTGKRHAEGHPNVNSAWGTIERWAHCCQINRWSFTDMQFLISDLSGKK